MIGINDLVPEDWVEVIIPRQVINGAADEDVIWDR